MDKVIVIVGPTGIGKTKLSIELSLKLNGEIINADSTQVYKTLDIATAKVTEEEKQNIVHHLIDIKDITQEYTVYDYQKDCRKTIKDILNKNKTPIIVGGTGLYIKASLYDYKFENEKETNYYENISDEDLFKKLISIDPNTQIHKNNRKRIVRALNYYDKTGNIPSSKEKTNKLLYNTIFIGLTTDRDTLYNKINDRVDLMIKNGLLKEAKTIYDSNIRTKAVMTPIGYKELFDYFDGKKTLEECVELIKKNSRNYAKRQYTWFNNQMNIKWFDVDFNDFNKTVLEVLKYIEKDVNS